MRHNLKIGQNFNNIFFENVSILPIRESDIKN